MIRTMELPNHWLLLLLFLLSSGFIARTSAGDSKDATLQYSKLMIDCGASQPTSFNDSDSVTLQWLPDDNFTTTGNTFLFNTPNLTAPVNSLRFFNSGDHNCYELPFWNANTKFLFRAGFFYGNYDSVSRPPRFDLKLDGHFWATVESTMSQDEVVYYEMIYRTKEKSVKVCLVQTEPKDIPFISYLEAYALRDEMYRYMDNDTALFLHSRTNYGANDTIMLEIGSLEERYGRIWVSDDQTGYENIVADPLPFMSLLDENQPPWPVMGTAIQAPSPSDSINVPIDFSSYTNNATAYIVLYFKDPVVRDVDNQTGNVDIFIDQTKYGSVDIPGWLGYGTDYRVVSLYPIVVNGTATVTISPAGGTEVPPVLNAMEVFSVADVSHAQALMDGCFTFFSLLASIVYLFVLVPRDT